MVNQATLKLLINELNSHNIIWGVGGSYLLQLYELYSDPNDLDLWVQPCDMCRIREIFKQYTEVETHIPLPKELHFKMVYIDIEVDFVACFITKPNQHQFTYKIAPNNIRTIVLKNGIEIPCTFLEDWYIIYRLLKRDDKANLIRTVFKKKKMPLDEKAVKCAIENNENTLPVKLHKDAFDLIDTATQLSLFDNDNI